MAKGRKATASPRATSEFVTAAIDTKVGYFRKADILALYPGLAPIITVGSGDALPVNVGCTIFLRSGWPVAVSSGPDDIYCKL